MRILFTSVVGAVIGYITNWFAIKMLFRPHTEKRIFGIKIPFTPGLIPKEKNRIAKSVGDAIGDHLLTSETLVESLCSDEMNSKLRKWVKNKISELEDKGVTLGEEFRAILNSKFESTKKYIDMKINQSILSTIKSDRFKVELENIIKTYITKELQRNPEELLQSVYYKNAKENILAKCVQYKNSEGFRNGLADMIEIKFVEMSKSEKTLQEIIPVGVIGSLKVYLYNRREEISVFIRKFIEKDEIKNKIRNSITGMINANLNPMVAMFMNADSIFEKVMIAIDDHLEKEENQTEMILIIDKLIDEVLKNNISDLIENLSREKMKSNSVYLASILGDKVLTEEILDKLGMSIEEKISSYTSIQQILHQNNVNVNSIIEELVDSLINSISNNKEFEEKIGEFVTEFIGKVEMVTIRDISLWSGRDISESASNFAQNIYDKFVENNATDFIEAFEIRKIVEDKINSFEVSYAEEIILEIASKELNAITWLGAVLGCLMGFISSLLASI